MPEFGIYWSISGEIYSDEDKRSLLKWNLNDEWSIVCVLQKEVDMDLNCDFRYTCIELHREYALEKVSISGFLSFHYINSELWSKKISCFMKTGLKSIEIVSDMNLRYTPNRCKLFGLLRIPDIGENEESKAKIQRKSLEGLSKDLERVFDPESFGFADVLFTCGNDFIPAHKVILSARSPHFANILANPSDDVDELGIDVMGIDAMEKSVFRELVAYIYTGKTSDLTASSAEDLLIAAEKYQLQDLKMVCIYFLKNNISLKNVGRILNLGDKHSENLKSFALDYIWKKFGEYSVFEKTQAWKDLRPNLAVEVKESLVRYKDEKRKRLRF